MRRDLKSVLTAMFVACMVVSNVLTAKQVELPFGLSATGGIVLFPLVYVLSDVFSECYGYRWSRVTCYLAFAATAFAALVFQLVIALPPSPYWDGQQAFAVTLGNTPRILFASLLAYLVGDFANDLTFRGMRSRGGGFKSRAFASSVVGEIVDSAIFYPIALFGILPAVAILQTALLEVGLKLAYEALVLPLTECVTRIVGCQG